MVSHMRRDNSLSFPRAEGKQAIRGFVVVALLLVPIRRQRARRRVERRGECAGRRLAGRPSDVRVHPRPQGGNPPHQPRFRGREIHLPLLRCVDPSHGDERPAAEGNFGMPARTSANWYWGGFLNILINGKDATRYRLADLRVMETGRRGPSKLFGPTRTPTSACGS